VAAVRPSVRPAVRSRPPAFVLLSTRFFARSFIRLSSMRVRRRATEFSLFASLGNATWTDDRRDRNASLRKATRRCNDARPAVYSDRRELGYVGFHCVEHSRISFARAFQAHQRWHISRVLSPVALSRARRSLCGKCRSCRVGTDRCPLSRALSAIELSIGLLSKSAAIVELWRSPLFFIFIRHASSRVFVVSLCFALLVPSSSHSRFARESLHERSRLHDFLFIR